MIYCSLEPGLVDLAELQPHDTDIAFSVVNSLLLHRKMILRFGAKIPVTDEFIALVISDLEQNPHKKSSSARNLRELILEILARQVKPSLVPAGLDNTRLSPSIVSPWISDNLREIWLDTLVAAVTDLLQSSKEHQLTIATWYRIELPNEAILSNQALIDFSADRKTDWGIRVLSMGHDWQVVHAIASEWPQGIEVLVENYAGRVLVSQLTL